MNKLAMAVFTAAALTTASILPALAQSTVPCPQRQCGEREKSSDVPCGEQLGHLKRVYPDEVLGIDDHLRVWVTEFCPGSDLMRSDGNADYLRPAIAQNDVLVDVLRGRGYFPADVFAVRMMGEDTISLYVHRFGN